MEPPQESETQTFSKEPEEGNRPSLSEEEELIADEDVQDGPTLIQHELQEKEDPTEAGKDEGEGSAASRQFDRALGSVAETSANERPAEDPFEASKTQDPAGGIRKNQAQEFEFEDPVDKGSSSPPGLNVPLALLDIEKLQMANHKHGSTVAENFGGDVGEARDPETKELAMGKSLRRKMKMPLKFPNIKREKKERLEQTSWPVSGDQNRERIEELELEVDDKVDSETNPHGRAIPLRFFKIKRLNKANLELHPTASVANATDMDREEENKEEGQKFHDDDGLPQLDEEPTSGWSAKSLKIPFQFSAKSFTKRRQEEGVGIHDVETLNVENNNMMVYQTEGSHLDGSGQMSREDEGSESPAEKRKDIPSVGYGWPIINMFGKGKLDPEAPNPFLDGLIGEPKEQSTLAGVQEAFSAGDENQAALQAGWESVNANEGDVVEREEGETSVWRQLGVHWPQTIGFLRKKRNQGVLACDVVEHQKAGIIESHAGDGFSAKISEKETILAQGTSRDKEFGLHFASFLPNQIKKMYPRTTMPTPFVNATTMDMQEVDSNSEHEDEITLWKHRGKLFLEMKFPAQEGKRRDVPSWVECFQQISFACPSFNSSPDGVQRREIPLWRQRRLQVSFGLIVLLSIAALWAGVLVNQRHNGSSTSSLAETLLAMPSSIPSNAPSTKPSATPSAMQSYSSAPTVTSMPTSLPSSIPTHTLSPTSFETETFGFYLMGDIPYSPWEEKVLADQMINLTLHRNSNALFTVHVGDMQKPERTKCVNEGYATVASYLKMGPLPTFVLPGDNDWVDCKAQEESLALFRSHFAAFETKWSPIGNNDTTAAAGAGAAVHASSDSILNTVVHNEEFPEIFSFSRHGILFVSVHLISSMNIEDWEVWDHRMQTNIAWVKQQVLDYGAAAAASAADPLRGVIIFGHGQFSPDTDEFFEGIAPLFLEDPRHPEYRSLPVMYMHGDGHSWDATSAKVRDRFAWDAFQDVQVDQGAYGDPCLVEIAARAGRVLEAEGDRQHVFGNGIFRVDRQRGRAENGIGRTPGY